MHSSGWLTVAQLAISVKNCARIRVLRVLVVILFFFIGISLRDPSVPIDPSFPRDPRVLIDQRVPKDPSVPIDPSVLTDPSVSRDPRVLIDQSVSIDPRVLIDQSVPRDPAKAFVGQVLFGFNKTT
jgi:hypothetical protein